MKKHLTLITFLILFAFSCKESSKQTEVTSNSDSTVITEKKVETPKKSTIPNARACSLCGTEYNSKIGWSYNVLYQKTERKDYGRYCSSECAYQAEK